MVFWRERGFLQLGLQVRVPLSARMMRKVFVWSVRAFLQQALMGVQV
tara:strand:- start:395 stop:535 length:141 start_codon:yes stop_codon:yes gene_type:complete